VEFFRIKKDIPFMRYSLAFNVISVTLFALAVFFLISRGLHLSIEFTGGTVTKVTYGKPANLENIRKTIDSLGYANSQVTNFGSAQNVMIRLPKKKGESAYAQSAVILKSLLQKDNNIQLRTTEFVGPEVSEEVTNHGLMALLFVVIGVAVYLAFRFEWRYAIAAIVANLHDVIIILGFFAFFQWEFSLTVLAAILAVLGYSINESVVVFDRMRETFHDHHFKEMAVADVINHSITSIISRTIITHGSTEIMVLSMLIFGGPSLHYFALALTIGILCGIYSSVFIAASTAMLLGIKRRDVISSMAT
jgi:preprotein translocase subunit SecF